jgi:uncharacterized repeat protein (TIGR03847 family)
MPRIEIELLPVDHLTTDAIGPKGQRVFYIQGVKDDQVATMIAEKFQVQSLAVGVEQFLAEIAEKFPDIPDASADYDESLMRIYPPVDPLFRISRIELGYNTEDDLVVLLIHELVPDESDEEPGIVRLWCTRSQLRALGFWSVEVASRGRPICPQCGQPEEPEGHFCVKKNGGHRRN